jgi:hypothetical protein
LELPYDIVPYRRDPKTRLAPPALKAFTAREVAAIRGTGLVVADYPNLAHLTERLKERPACRRAIARGGPWIG